MSSYNKMSAIQIGGTYINTIPIGARGNVSLDCSGNSLFRGTSYMDSDLTLLGNLAGSSNASFSGTLSVTNDASFNKLLKVTDPADSTSNITMGFNLNNITRTFNVTGLSSAVQSGTAFRPVTFTIPKGNVYDTLYFKLPLNLFSGINGSAAGGTWTLTYSSVTMAVYKNSVLDTTAGASISEVGFSAATSKTANAIASYGGMINVQFYFGYFTCYIPIEVGNASTNTYEIELTITGTATHSPDTLSLWVAANAVSYVGYGLTTPKIFTTTKSLTPSTYFSSSSSTPTYTTPDYSVDSGYATIANNTGDLHMNSQFDMTLTAANSFKFKALNGYWTAENEIGNFYYNGTSTDCGLFLSTNIGEQMRIQCDAVAPSNAIYSNDIPLLIDSGTANFNMTCGNDMSLGITDTLDINCNIITMDATTSIALNAPSVTIPAASTFTFTPTGTIIQKVTSSVPSGYLYCDGTAVSRTTYSRLFADIGTTFGAGDGSTTFNLPNFKGAFLRGASSQTISGVTYTAAAVGTAQQDQVLETTIYATNEGFRDCAAGTRECVARSRITTDPVDTNTGILAQFQRQGSENRPFNYSVYYFIKY